MEVGSCIRLSADNRFEYFLAYGAYDENAQGTWRLSGGGIVVDTPDYDKRPVFTFDRLQRADDDRYGVVVESVAGRSIAGIEVDVTCDGRTKNAGVTQARRLQCRLHELHPARSLWVCACMMSHPR